MRISPKSAYVALVRALAAVLRRTGLLRLLDRWAAASRRGLWVRSLLGVYDARALVAWDVPWWTFDSADRTAAFLAGRPGARVLEWGSGASTLWLAARAGSVTAIEHDAAWAAQVRELLAEAGAGAGGRAEVDLRVVTPRPVPAGEVAAVPSAKAGFAGLDFAAYVAEVDAVEGDFDLVVVDGRAREACLERAVRRLAPGGLVVVDNVDRERYRDAIARVADPDRVVWTRGLTPTLPYPTRTALVGADALREPAW